MYPLNSDGGIVEEKIPVVGVLPEKVEMVAGAEVLPEKNGKTGGLSWQKVAVILGIAAVVLVGGGVLAGFLMRGEEKNVRGAVVDDVVDEEWLKAVEEDKKFAITGLTEIYKYEWVKVVWDEGYASREYRGADRYCFNIVGLVNKTVQDKINGELRAAYNEAAGKYPVTEHGVRCEVGGNFGGVFSAMMQLGTNNEGDSLIEGFAWRLDTGGRIKFEDVFLKGSNLPVIVEDAVYQTRLYEAQMHWCMYDGEYYKTHAYTDKSDAECNRYAATQVDMAAVERAVYEYRNDPDVEFYFDTQWVRFRLGESMIQLKLETIWDKVAIYKRFRVDGLISNGGGSKNAFVFTVGPSGDGSVMYGVEMVGKNLVRVDLDLADYVSNYTPAAVLATVKAERAAMWSDVKKYAGSHVGKMLYYVDFGGMTDCYELDTGNYDCGAMDVWEKNFGEAAKQEIAEGFRTFGGGLGFSIPYGDELGWEKLGGDDGELGDGLRISDRIEVAPSGEVVDGPAGDQ